jgi:hypothetical protein
MASGVGDIGGTCWKPMSRPKPRILSLVMPVLSPYSLDHLGESVGSGWRGPVVRVNWRFHSMTICAEANQQGMVRWLVYRGGRRRLGGQTKHRAIVSLLHAATPLTRDDAPPQEGCGS